jgi:hypothetical protein
LIDGIENALIGCFEDDSVFYSKGQASIIWIPRMDKWLALRRSRCHLDGKNSIYSAFTSHI